MKRIEEIVVENQTKLNDSKLPASELFCVLIINCMEQYGRELLAKAAENATILIENTPFGPVNIVDKQSILDTEL
jgi:hypothetical protein